MLRLLEHRTADERVLRLVEKSGREARGKRAALNRARALHNEAGDERDREPDLALPTGTTA